MKFTLDKDITYEQAVERMFEMLGDWKIMALASSVNDYVMVRNVSCLFYDEKIWFKTDKNFRKTKQLLEHLRSGSYFCRKCLFSSGLYRRFWNSIKVTRSAALAGHGLYHR